MILSLVTRKLRPAIERVQVNTSILPPEGLKVHGQVAKGKSQKMRKERRTSGKLGFETEIEMLNRNERQNVHKGSYAPLRSYILTPEMLNSSQVLSQIKLLLPVTCSSVKSVLISN